MFTKQYRSHIISLYLVSVILSSYPLLNVVNNGTTVLRIDWILFIPLVGIFARHGWIRLGIASRYALLMICAGIISVVLNNVFNIIDFLTFYIQFVYVIGMFCVISSVKLTSAEWEQIIRSVVFALIAISIFAVVEVLVTNIFPELWLNTYFVDADRLFGGYSRPRSFTSEPAWFGSLLLVGISILFPIIACKNPVLFKKSTEYAVFTLFLLMLILTVSFTAYFTFLGALVFYLLISQTRPLVIKFIPVGIGVISILIVSPIGFLDIIMFRIQRITELVLTLSLPERGSLYLRLGSLLIGFAVWVKNPIFGVGIGQFTWWQEANPVEIAGLSTVGATHNVWIQVLSTMGIVGFIPFLFIMVSIFRESYNYLRANDPRSQVWKTVVISLTFVTLISWTFGQSLVNPMKWAFLAIAYNYVMNFGGY